MATYTGIGGTATFGGSTVAQIDTWTVSGSIDPIDTTTMGAKWKTTVGGLAGWRATLNCILDLTTGQLAMAGNIFAVTPTLTSAAVVLTLATGKTWTGNAVVTSSNITHTGSSSAVGKGTFELVGDGQLVEAWA